MRWFITSHHDGENIEMGPGKYGLFVVRRTNFDALENKARSRGWPFEISNSISFLLLSGGFWRQDVTD